MRHQAAASQQPLQGPLASEGLGCINILSKPGYKKDVPDEHINSCVESIHLDLLSWMREDDSRAIFKSSQGSCLPSIVEFSQFVLSNSTSSTSAIADQVTLVSQTSTYAFFRSEAPIGHADHNSSSQRVAVPHRVYSTFQRGHNPTR